LFVNDPNLRKERAMKKRLSFLFFGFFFAVLFCGAAFGWTTRKEPPVFKTHEEERLYQLAHGEILTDGGYMTKGAWGIMEGVIQAPPAVVWNIFIHPENWVKYHFPNLVDSRPTDAKISEKISSTPNIQDFYREIGNKVIDPVKTRKDGGTWISYTFQSYDLPWPLSDRWMILKNQMDETERGVYRATWIRAAGNIRTMEGSLLLKPFDGNPNLTFLEYQVRSDPGSNVPKFLLRWGIKKTMPAAIQAIRRGAAAEIQLNRPDYLLR
jgi:hypothetical protein